MSPLTFIPAGLQVWVRLALYVIVAIAGAASAWEVKGWKDDSQLATLQAQWNAEHAKQAEAIRDQTARNLDLQRAAEKRYVVTRDGQDHYFTQTIKEIVHDAAPLASCPVPRAVRVRINAAIDCASADPAPTCGALGQVPGAAEAAGRGHGQ